MLWQKISSLSPNLNIVYLRNFVKLYENFNDFFMVDKREAEEFKEEKLNEAESASNNIYIQNSQILLWKFVNVIWDEIEFSTFPISSNFQQQQ